MEKLLSKTITYGKNIRRLREILGVKQETIALGLNISQQAMSNKCITHSATDGIYTTNYKHKYFSDEKRKIITYFISREQA